MIRGGREEGGGVKWSEADDEHLCSRSRRRAGKTKEGRKEEAEEAELRQQLATFLRRRRRKK